MTVPPPTHAQPPPLRRPRDDRRRAGIGLRLGRGAAAGGAEDGSGQRLRVDWPQCKAHGLCAEIAPEIIGLDEWGYPLFDHGELSAADRAPARKAAQVCPTLALRLTDVPRR